MLIVVMVTFLYLKKEKRRSIIDVQRNEHASPELSSYLGSGTTSVHCYRTST